MIEAHVDELLAAAEAGIADFKGRFVVNDEGDVLELLAAEESGLIEN